MWNTGLNLNLITGCDALGSNNFIGNSLRWLAMSGDTFISVTWLCCTFNLTNLGIFYIHTVLLLGFILLFYKPN